VTTISLREWETARPEPGSTLAQRSLATYPAARRLAEELTATGRMEMVELARGLELRATSLSDVF
jgi:5-methylcytosine-specific restriction enzyme subunit McrC